MNILLLFLLSIEIFPSNSQDFCAYGISLGGGIIGERITNLATDDYFFRLLGGVGGSIAFSLIFSDHMTTNEEKQWNRMGRGHLLVWCGITFGLEELFKKKPKKAYAETIQKHTRHGSQDYDEYIEFGLEQ